MIALYDDFNQHDIKKNKRISSAKVGIEKSSNEKSSNKQPRHQQLGNKSPSRIKSYSYPNNLIHKSVQRFSSFRQARKERKIDRLALQQLMQLDDSLLKDMGIERNDLIAVGNGELTLDALNKHNIVAARDVGSNTTFIWK